MVIKGYEIWPLLKKTFSEIGRDNISLLAGSAAYNFFFSLFPLLLFLTPLLSVVGDKQKTFAFIVQQLVRVIPADQVAPFQQIIRQIVFAKDAPGLMSIGVLLAGWSASNIFGTLMTALNTAYHVTETRSWLKQQAIRLSSFAMGAVILMASTVVILNGEGIADWLGHALRLGSVAIMIWKIGQFPLALAFLGALAFLMLALLPNVNQRRGQVVVAATVTTVLWVLATLLFRLYLKHFPPNKAYGLIGTVLILLTWMYYTMFVLLAGGELASEIHLGSGAVAPMKGTVYFGRVVSSDGPSSPSVGVPKD